MPDRRQHRGPHPQDADLFAADRLPALDRAARDMSWLLDRGYNDTAALTLVGDHFQLQRRQRMAVWRSACTPAQARHRRAIRRDPAGQDLAVDGFNVLVTAEAALAGGVLLRGHDGLLRDLSSMHGSYRRVAETARAIELLSAALQGAGDVLWLLDRPVSNSGRVAALLRDAGWRAELVDGADRAALDTGRAIATADGPLLDKALAGVDLVGRALGGLDPWVVTFPPPWELT